MGEGEGERLRMPARGKKQIEIRRISELYDAEIESRIERSPFGLLCLKIERTNSLQSSSFTQSKSTSPSAENIHVTSTASYH